MQNKLREKYEIMFTNYPDVLELNNIRQMLGGVSDKYVRLLLQNGSIKSFQISIRGAYKIPKTYFIDFVISDTYQENKHRLKVQI